MSTEWHDALLRELDQIRQSFEKAIDRLEKHDESRDEEVSGLKLEVGLLRGECKRNIRRDAGLVIAPTTIVTIVQAVLQHWSPTPLPPPTVPTPAPIAEVRSQ